MIPPDNRKMLRYSREQSGKEKKLEIKTQIKNTKTEKEYREYSKKYRG